MAKADDQEIDLTADDMLAIDAAIAAGMDVADIEDLLASPTGELEKADADADKGIEVTPEDMAELDVMIAAGEDTDKWLADRTPGPAKARRRRKSAGDDIVVTAEELLAIANAVADGR